MRHRYLLSVMIVSCIGMVCANIWQKKWPERKEIDEIAGYRRQMDLWQDRYAPDLELSLSDGTTFKLSENVGKKIVVLNFFTTWCGPCKKEMPELVRFCKSPPGSGLLLIGIDCGETLDVLKTYREKENLRFPMGADTERIIMNAYEVESFPTTVLVGLDGKVALYQVGMISNADVAFSGVLDSQKVLDSTGRRISQEAYMKALALQGPIGGSKNYDREAGKRVKVQLDQQRLEIADKLACADCEKSCRYCTCEFCEKMKSKLATLQVEGKSEDQIIRDLILKKTTNLKGAPHGARGQ
jgi:thiol-disulfide isomerase/thioredoxin